MYFLPFRHLRRGRIFGVLELRGGDLLGRLGWWLYGLQCGHVSNKHRSIELHKLRGRAVLCFECRCLFGMFRWILFGRRRDRLRSMCLRQVLGLLGK